MYFSLFVYIYIDRFHFCLLLFIFLCFHFMCVRFIHDILIIYQLAVYIFRFYFWKMAHQRNRKKNRPKITEQGSKKRKETKLRNITTKKKATPLSLPVVLFISFKHLSLSSFTNELSKEGDSLGFIYFISSFHSDNSSISSTNLGNAFLAIIGLRIFFKKKYSHLSLSIFYYPLNVLLKTVTYRSNIIFHFSKTSYIFWQKKKTKKV